MSSLSPGFRIGRDEVNVYRLERARRRRYMTYTDWANDARVSRQTLWNFLSGKHKIYLYNLERLAKALELTVEEALECTSSRETVDPESINVDLLNRARRRLGYRLETVARMTGMSDARVRNAFKRGQYFGPPTMQTLQLLAEVLDLELSDVIQDREDGAA